MVPSYSSSQVIAHITQVSTATGSYEIDMTLEGVSVTTRDAHQNVDLLRWALQIPHICGLALTTRVHK